jgi:hypothetical protein
MYDFTSPSETPLKYPYRHNKGVKPKAKKRPQLARDNQKGLEPGK